METGGYIKLYRTILDWEWFADAYAVQLWVCLLLMANREDKCVKGKIYRKGTVTTSAYRLADQLGTHHHTIRSRLRLLEENGAISIARGAKSITIEVIKYSEYQDSVTSSVIPSVIRDITQNDSVTSSVIPSVISNGTQNKNIRNIYIPPSSSSGCAHAREGEGKLWMELVADEKFWNDAHKMLGLEIAKLKEYAKEFDEEMWAKKKSWKGGYEDYASHCVSWIRRKLELSHTTYTPGTRGKGQQHQPRPSLDSSGNPIDRIAVAKANAQQNAAERRYKASREEMNELMVHYPTLNLKDRESVANALEEIRRRKKK